MRLRSYFGRSSLAAPLVVSLAITIIAAPLAACAGREWAHAHPAKLDGPAAVDRPAPTASGEAALSPFISPSADPVCGDLWKWDGVRCQQLEGITRDDSALAKSGPSRKSPGAIPQLLMSDLRPGDGKEARRGDTVRVHYVGTLADGTEFDSSRRRDTPLEFQLGTNAVIKGFDTAVVGMKIGGLRRVTIPPELGYGTKGSPPKIPANATLVFEIELVDIVND